MGVDGVVSKNFDGLFCAKHSPLSVHTSNKLQTAQRRTSGGHCGEIGWTAWGGVGGIRTCQRASKKVSSFYKCSYDDSWSKGITLDTFKVAITVCLVLSHVYIHLLQYTHQPQSYSNDIQALTQLRHQDIGAWN